MGYRSDVAIVMKAKDFHSMLGEAKRSSIEWLNGWLMGAYRNQNAKNKPWHKVDPNSDEWIALYWEWVKWYESYEEIDFVENFLHKINQYDFVRIGEDYEDTEVIYKSQNYLIGVERKITIDI